ncbi:MAG: hypothetical protein V7K53_29980 [Nostoc sp.]|uniref:hypothetical protein n=1 Tax=Nostoc sp. TaxID=1180 RepID=UPI002FF8EB99
MMMLMRSPSFNEALTLQEAIPSTISVIKSYLTMHKLEILLTSSIKGEYYLYFKDSERMKNDKFVTSSFLN